MRADPTPTPAAELGTMLDRLKNTGGHELHAVSGERLATAWWAATEDLDRCLPDDLVRRMASASGLSAEGLLAGLGVVVRGVHTEACRSLLTDSAPPAEPLPPALAVLASNLPALALQCLLPALAARRPLLLKTPSVEPDFTPWILRRLAEQEPALRSALAAAAWRGGDRGVEDLVLPRVSRVVAYGGDGTLTDLRLRTDAAGSKLVALGAKISLGLVVANDDLNIDGIAEGLARDVALFDQRGCLSVHSVLVLDAASGDTARSLADGLAAQLERLAVELPPGPAETRRLAAVRAIRDEAAMAGHRVADLPLRHGTMILEDRMYDPPLAAKDGAGPATRLESPGLRTVRVIPIASHRTLEELLEPWRGRIQGVALAGRGATKDHAEAPIAELLRSLGVSRIAAAGELQATDAATWHNGGWPPQEIYAASRGETVSAG